MSGRICRHLQMAPDTCRQVQMPAARFQTPADSPQTPPTCIQTDTNPTQTPRNSPRHPPDDRPDGRSTGSDRQTPRKHPKFGVHSAFEWNPLWPQRGGVSRCLQVSGGVWPDTPSGQGLTIVLAARPPSFFLNPCRIGHLESTCTQCACAARNFGSAVCGWSMGGAAPMVEECSSRVVACVFGGGAPVFGVHFVGFQRPF